MVIANLRLRRTEQRPQPSTTYEHTTQGKVDQLYNIACSILELLSIILRRRSISIMATTSNPIDYFAIQNTISQYCIALDTKNWSLLDSVFVQDVDAKYPFGGAIKGVKPLADKIQDR